ncbi:MAG: tetratricopeptide repeat protein [Candidatus Hodarchaeales archaeon]
MSNISPSSDLTDHLQLLLQEYRENPTSHVVLRELGKTYRDMAQFDTAMFYLEQALTVNPGDWEALVVLGSLYAEKEDHEAALSHYSRAYELSNETDLLGLVGEALYHLKRFKIAESHLRLTLRLEGSLQRGFSHFILGKVLCALDRFEEAFDEFRAAEKFKKSDETSRWLKFAKTKMSTH